MKLIITKDNNYIYNIKEYVPANITSTYIIISLYNSRKLLTIYSMEVDSC